MKKISILSLVMFLSIAFSACNPLESKTKSGIQVITNDVSSSLFLNDEYLDKTPYINKTIKPGVYTIRIEPDDENLTTYETTVTLNKGLLTVLTWKPGPSPETSGGVIYELEKLDDKKRADISFTTIPDSAIISFDGGESQFSPLLLENVEPGHHEFEIKLPSYETQKHTINVVEGNKLLISVKMAKDGGYEITTDEESAESGEDNTEENDSVEIADEIETEIAENVDDDTSENDDPTPTEEPEDEDVVEEDEIANDEETSKNTETDSDKTASGVVLIKSTNFFQDEEEVLRVRDAATASGNELGFAVVGEEYDYLGEKDNGWYMIDFEGEEGWVSGKYVELSEE